MPESSIFIRLFMPDMDMDMDMTEVVALGAGDGFWLALDGVL